MKNILLSFLFIFTPVMLLQAQSDVPEKGEQYPHWAVNVFNVDSLNSSKNCKDKLNHPNYKGINTEADELAPVISGNGRVLYFVRVEIDTLIRLANGTEFILDYVENQDTYWWYAQHWNYLYRRNLSELIENLSNIPTKNIDTVLIQQQDIWVTWRDSTDMGWGAWEKAQKLPYPINNEYQNVVCNTNDDGTQIFLSNQYIPIPKDENIDSPSNTNTTYSMVPGISVTSYSGNVDKNFPTGGIWGEIQNIEIEGFFPNRDSHFFFQLAPDSSFIIFSAHLNDRANYLEEDLYIAFNDKIDFKRKLSEVRDDENSTDNPTTDEDKPLGFANIISLGPNVNNKEGKTLKSRDNIITKTFRREYLPQHTFETAPFLSANGKRLYFTRVERFLSTIKEKNLKDEDKIYSEVSLYEINRNVEDLSRLWATKVSESRKANKLTVADSLEFVWSDPAMWGDPVKIYDEFQSHDEILHTANFESYLNLHTDTHTNFEDYGFLSMKVDSCMNADIYEIDFTRAHLLKVEVYSLNTPNESLSKAQPVVTDFQLHQVKPQEKNFRPTKKDSLEAISKPLAAGKRARNIQWFEFFLDPNSSGRNKDNTLQVSLGENTHVYDHKIEKITVPEDSIRIFRSYIDSEGNVVPFDDTTSQKFDRIENAEILYAELNGDMIYDHNKNPNVPNADKILWTVDTKTITDSLKYVDVLKVYVLRPSSEEPRVIASSIPDEPEYIDPSGEPIKIVYVEKPCPCDTTDIVSVPEIFTLQGVLFQPLQWDLEYQYQVFLDQVVQVLNTNPNYMISLGGYTDYKGSEEENKILSQRRVSSVKNYLVSGGISPDRIYTNFYGEASHLRDLQGSSDSYEARRRSRRVVIEQIAAGANFDKNETFFNTENKEITIIVNPDTGKIEEVRMPE